MREEGLRKVEKRVQEAAAAAAEIGEGVLREVQVEGRWGPGVEGARSKLLVFSMEVGRGGGGGVGQQEQQQQQQQQDDVTKKEEKEEEEEEEGEKIQRALVTLVEKIMRRAFSEEEVEEGEEGREEVPPLSGLVLESLTFQQQQQQQQQGEKEEGQVWVVEDPYMKKKQ